MALKWLVDGYNLLHLVPEFKFELDEDINRALNHLITVAGDFAARSKATVTVIFDGSPPDGPDSIRRARGVTVRFVGTGQKADPLIKRLIAAEGNRRQLVVVSADREIADYARVCGARVEHPRTFQEKLVDRPSKENGELLNKFDPPRSDREIQEWLELFGRLRDEET